MDASARRNWNRLSENGVAQAGLALSLEILFAVGAEDTLNYRRGPA